MSIGLLYWILMLLWLVFFGVGTFGPAIGPYWGYGTNLLLFILLALLGWRVFGAAVHG